MTESRPPERPANPNWDDSVRFEGVVAFSFVLPFLLPLEPQSVPIRVDDDYLRIRGVAPAEFDDAWMQMPLSCLTMWSVAADGTDPVIKDTTVASAALAHITGGEPRPAPPPSDDYSRKRSAVVVVIPVKSRTAALTPPHDGKVDPLTLAHWLIADTVRSSRIASKAPIPELHYRSLNPIVPAAFGTVCEGGQVSFATGQTVIVLDHLPARMASVSPVDPAVIGNIFGQLTRGSISVLIRDHFARAHSEHSAGDRRASVLSLAITCELMLDSTLAAMLWEEGETPAQAAQVWADASSITQRVKSMYSGRLGGSWHIDGVGPVGHWREHIVDIRNSVIHSGRTPSEPESEKSAAAASELLTFVSKRLVLKWKTYPKTLAVLCGRSSVETHASKKQRANVLAELERCSTFAVEFHRWRDEWLEERTLL
ncbi:hypothetical protein [Mycobacterium simiae]|uniref:hypothetical protein n=1 Tax=Mycobacterium simiae TaxID=1784 RepID=UPI0004038230|nr:hypothetical protein [Mycobacterium simiae]PLV48017.1 hypothetical protein X011_17745 [Mycobacterium tuberculosis variant microti OV254]BBX43920.1 hypothetical protein MSIM_53710 [Mycobacterium simiae]